MDRRHVEAGGSTVDLQLEISAPVLSSLVGQAAMLRLENAFGVHAYDLIKLRRVGAAPGKCIPFHVDTHARRTMHVALNTEYAGGRPVFVNAAGFNVPARPPAAPPSTRTGSWMASHLWSTV